MKGRFKSEFGTFFPFRTFKAGGVSIRIDSKGYPVFKSGACRDQRVHRVVAQAMHGKPLTRDCDVHHRNQRKLDWTPENLEILSKEQHGWWSAIQHWYVPRVIAEREKKEWEEFLGGGHYERTA